MRKAIETEIVIRNARVDGLPAWTVNEVSDTDRETVLGTYEYLADATTHATRIREQVR